MPRLNSARELEHLRQQLRQQRQNVTTTVMVCGGTGWSDCEKCVNPASEERLAAKRDRQGELSRQANR